MRVEQVERSAIHCKTVQMILHMSVLCIMRRVRNEAYIEIYGLPFCGFAMPQKGICPFLYAINNIGTHNARIGI